jgi:hypothetical protein
MAAIGVQNASALIQFRGKIEPPDGECRGLTGNRPKKTRTDWFSLPYPRHFSFYLRALRIGDHTNSAAYRTWMSRVGCTSKPIQVEFTKSIVVWLAALDVLKLLIFASQGWPGSQTRLLRGISTT